LEQGELVAEHQDLCVLGGIVHPEDPEQFDDTADQALEEPERHGRKRRRTRPAWSRRRSSKWTLQVAANRAAIQAKKAAKAKGES
jgi:hypothetical protein